MSSDLLISGGLVSIFIWSRKNQPIKIKTKPRLKSKSEPPRQPFPDQKGTPRVSSDEGTVLILEHQSAFAIRSDRQFIRSNTIPLDGFKV